MVITRNKRIAFNPSSTSAPGAANPGNKEVIELTYEAAKILKQSSLVERGKFYLITSSLTRTHINLRGQILLLGEGEDSFSLEGSYYALLPDYKTYPVWATGTMASIVIYNGKTWEMTNEDANPPGTSPSWTEVPNPVLEIDRIEYDFDNDWISLRSDKRTNIVSGGKQYENGWGNGFNIVERFQWGNDLHYGNFIHDSAVDILNTRGQFYENRLVNNSGFSDNNLAQGAVFANNEFSRSSFSGNSMAPNVYFTNNYSVNGWMGNNIFSGGYIIGNQVMGSSLSRNVMNAGFMSYNNIFPNGSIDDNFIADQSSSISGNTLRDNATINNNRMEAPYNYIYGNELGPHSTIRQNQLKAHTNYIMNNKFDHNNQLGNNVISGGNIFITNNHFASAAWLTNKTFLAGSGLEANKIDYLWNNVISLNTKISGGTLRVGFSNMEVKINITGLTTFTLAGSLHAGRIVLETTNGGETVNEILGIEGHHPFRVLAGMGKIVTLQRTALSALSAHNRLIMDKDVLLNGDNGDYAIFEHRLIRKNGVNYTCLKLIDVSISS